MQVIICKNYEEVSQEASRLVLNLGKTQGYSWASDGLYANRFISKPDKGLQQQRNKF